MNVQKTMKPGNAAARKNQVAAPEFPKRENGKLAMDESTVKQLFELRKRAFSDNPEISIDYQLFASLLKNLNAAVATMKVDGVLAGYMVATPIKESWVKNDLQEIKDVMRLNMGNTLFKKISAIMKSGACYYLDDLAVMMKGMGDTGTEQSPLSQLDRHTARFRGASDMVKSFFEQLDMHSANFLVLHGRMANNAYKGYTKRIEMNGFRKIHENVHPNWFGGEDFMLMVFEKV